MRIAIVTPSVTGTGGVESVNHYLVRAFQENGHTVKIFGLDSLPDGPLRRRAVRRWGAARVTGTWFNIINGLRRYDVVICNGEYAAAVRHPRAVNLFHGCYYGYAKALRRYISPDTYDALMREAEIQKRGAQGKTVVAVSEYIARLLREQGIGVDAVIPNAIDENLFHPDPVVEPTDECLFVGRYDYHGKGFDVLEALADRGVKIRCITDRDPKHPGLEWAPFVKPAALPAYYRRAACVIFPSRFESVGLVALEAMACGCPVVMSDVGIGSELALRFPESVIKGNPSDAIDEYAERITVVVRSGSSQLQKGRDYVLEHHTFSRFSAGWRELVSGFVLDSRHRERRIALEVIS